MTLHKSDPFVLGLIRHLALTHIMCETAIELNGLILFDCPVDRKSVV